MTQVMDIFRDAPLVGAQAFAKKLLETREDFWLIVGQDEDGTPILGLRQQPDNIVCITRDITQASLVHLWVNGGEYARDRFLEERASEHSETFIWSDINFKNEAWYHTISEPSGTTVNPPLEDGDKIWSAKAVDFIIHDKPLVASDPA